VHGRFGARARKAGFTPFATVIGVSTASLSNINIAAAITSATNIGGLNGLADGEYVGLFGQTTASQNGVYTINGGGAGLTKVVMDYHNAVVNIWGGTLAGSAYRGTVASGTATFAVGGFSTYFTMLHREAFASAQYDRHTFGQLVVGGTGAAPGDHSSSQ